MSTRTYLTCMAATMVVLLVIGLAGLTSLGPANTNREFKLEAQQHIVLCFAPAGRNVYSLGVAYVFGAP